MFWKRKDDKNGPKLAGPRDIPDMVKKELTPSMIDPDVIPFLKILNRNREEGGRIVEFRIFDPSEAEAKDAKIVNFNSLNENEDLIIGEGSYDEATKKASVNMRRNIPKYNLLTSDEILQKIESLKTDGDSVMFYTAAGTGSGGPLGRGATIVKLNPANGSKKPKKYGISGVKIVNMQPVSQSEVHIFDSDKSKEVAKWVSEAHKPRFC
jgi:hypothetical protein